LSEEEFVHFNTAAHHQSASVFLVEKFPEPVSSRPNPAGMSKRKAQAVPAESRNQKVPRWNTRCQALPVYCRVRSEQPEQFMKTKLFVVIGVTFSVAFAVQGQTPAPSEPAAKSAERTLLDKYCVGCHNQRTSNGLALDGKSIELSHVAGSPDKFEKVVRKLRAGMMPPSGAARPDAESLERLIVWLENELDRNVVTQLPPPGLIG
jgi:hypothetical protein